MTTVPPDVWPGRRMSACLEKQCDRLRRFLSVLGRGGVAYVLVVSLVALVLLMVILTGDGSKDYGWAWAGLVLIGLPGSLFAMILGVGIELLALLVASPFGIGQEGTGLSPLGYAVWGVIWLSYVAVVAVQAAAVRLAMRRWSARSR